MLSNGPAAVSVFFGYAIISESEAQVLVIPTKRTWPSSNNRLVVGCERSRLLEET